MGGKRSAALRVEERFQLRDTRLRGPARGGLPPGPDFGTPTGDDFLLARGGFPLGPGLGTPTGGGFLLARGGFPLGPDLGIPTGDGFSFSPGRGGPVRKMLLIVAEEVQARLRITESHLPALRPQLQAHSCYTRRARPVGRIRDIFGSGYAGLGNATASSA